MMTYVCMNYTTNDNFVDPFVLPSSWKCHPWISFIFIHETKLTFFNYFQWNFLHSWILNVLKRKQKNDESKLLIIIFSFKICTLKTIYLFCEVNFLDPSMFPLFFRGNILFSDIFVNEFLKLFIFFNEFFDFVLFLMRTKNNKAITKHILCKILELINLISTNHFD